MPFFIAEAGKKSYLLSATELASARGVLSFYHKDKIFKIEEASLIEPLMFRMAGGSLCTSVKVKGSIIYFKTDSNISGKIDISLLPIERA
jgi:hypothetical protein